MTEDELESKEATLKAILDVCEKNSGKHAARIGLELIEEVRRLQNIVTALRMTW